MLLRRITEHVKAQNWTAVALDFVIVVVGVFIGIQVSNWNEAQADARRGAEYAERLAADLKSDLQGRRELVDYFDAVNESIDNSIELLSSAAPDARDLVTNVYRSSEYTFNPQTRATWDEVVSAGEVALLPRKAVEESLSYYFAFDASERAADEMLTSPLRARVRRAIPHNIQKAIRAGCGDVRNKDSVVVGFVEDCRIDASDMDFAAAAEILRSDPQLIGELQLHASTLEAARSTLRGDITVLKRGITLLEEETSPSPGR